MGEVSVIYEKIIDNYKKKVVNSILARLKLVLGVLVGVFWF